MKEIALDIGFDLCGIARSRALDERAESFNKWLQQCRHGNLHYMERNTDKRLNPALLFENARSIVVCAVSYNRGNSFAPNEITSRIASYALSTDYHITIKEKLFQLHDYIKKEFPSSNSRAFVDTAPIMEKSWAVEAGLGWVGRNSLFISPHFGSFMLLGIIVTDAELPYDTPYDKDGCGDCRKCIDSCPAKAIGEDRMINASRCISALTIENATPASDALHGRIFGCDICQKVCPYNKTAPITENPMFSVIPEFNTLTREQWLGMKKEEFDLIFGRTPLSRSSLEVLQQRIATFTGGNIIKEL